MQVIIDPSEFSILEGRMFASFNKINLPLMGISGLIVLLAFLWLSSDFDKFDALTLGRNMAISLGVEYDKVVLKSLAAVSLFTRIDRIGGARNFSRHNNCKYYKIYISDIQAFRASFRLDFSRDNRACFRNACDRARIAIFGSA